MSKFRTIEARARARKGDELDVILSERLHPVLSAPDMAETADDRWLSAMAKGVFAAGFRWKVVQAKWAETEEAFIGFAPKLVASLSVDAERALAQDRRIIRNPQKIRAAIENAQMVQRVSGEHGSFGKFVSGWPDDDVIGLWAWLKANGTRLGGDTGPRVLRHMGKDTFILTGDVTHGLTTAGLMTAKPTSKRGQREAQAAFNSWRAETGRSMGELSMILAMSVDRPM